MDLLILVIVIFMILITLVCLGIILLYRWKQTLMKTIRHSIQFQINQDSPNNQPEITQANRHEDQIEINSQAIPQITSSSSEQQNTILSQNLNCGHQLQIPQYNYVESNSIPRDSIGSNTVPDIQNLQGDPTPQEYLPMIGDKQVIDPNGSGSIKDYSKFVDPSLIIDISDLYIGNKIGSGQFGTVRDAQLSMTKGKYAMKLHVAVKSPNNTTAKKEIKSLLQEATKMKNFDNKNVLSLIGVSFESNGTPLVVLPFMANGDLLTYLRDRNNMPNIKQLLYFALEVAKGMEYLSAQGFVHRDLAARNIMLDNDLSVKVADFGLSRILNTSSYYHSKLGGQLPIRWMSIESMQQNKYSTKSDAWSYGVLVWEIFSLGMTPYTGLSNCDVLAHLKSGQRLPRPFLCPEEVYKIQLLCWSVNSNTRLPFSKMKDNFESLIQQLDLYDGVMIRHSMVNKPQALNQHTLLKRRSSFT